jgi:hypothetical protein
MKRAHDPFPIFKRTGTPDNLREFDRSIGDTADHLIRELERGKRLPTNVKGLKREDVHFLAYALVVHRTRNGGVLTEDHLRLLAAALALRPDHVPSRAAVFFGLPPIKALKLDWILRYHTMVYVPEQKEMAEDRYAEICGLQLR